MKKKGVSPVIATVLLIAIVVVLAVIIYLWAKGFVSESISKKGINIEQACDEVQLQASYIKDTGDLQITNTGNIPIYYFNIKASSFGSIENILGNDSLSIGQSTIISLGDYEQIRISPVLLGEGKTSRKAYTCKNEFTPEED